MDGLDDPVDGKFSESYFVSSLSYISYFLHGGVDMISERDAKKAAADGFTETLPGGYEAKRANMEKFFARVENLRWEKDPVQVRKLLYPYVHMLNMRRKRNNIDDGKDW